MTNNHDINGDATAYSMPLIAKMCFDLLFCSTIERMMLRKSFATSRSHKEKAQAKLLHKDDGPMCVNLNSNHADHVSVTKHKTHNKKYKTHHKLHSPGTETLLHRHPRHFGKHPEGVGLRAGMKVV